MGGSNSKPKSASKEKYDSPQTFATFDSLVADPLAWDPSQNAEAWHGFLRLQGLIVGKKESKVVATALKSVANAFPGALASGPLMKLVDDALEAIGGGFTADATLFATSLCPDEINHEEGDLPNRMSKRFGEMFALGGLAGVPFTGQSGFKAFAHHVPDGGKIFVLFGPHVAISPTGEVGKYRRNGQSHDSSACGACTGALDAVERAGGPRPNDGKAGITIHNQHDMQIEFLIQQVEKRYGAICAHEAGKQVGLAYEAYELSKEMMLQTIDASILKGGELVMLGGIQINAPAPLEDFFLPLYFSVHRDKKSSLNMLDRITGRSIRMPLGQSLRALDATHNGTASTGAVGWAGYLELQGVHVDPENEAVLVAAIGSIRMNFPGAIANRPLMTLLDKVLDGQGFTAKATIFGSSLCPDEINHEEGDLPNLMTAKFGEHFALGGLGGMPFTGKFGFNAFAHHVPDNGKIFILFGPHVAISPTGEVGKYQRDGQDHESAACGACIGAMAVVESKINSGFTAVDHYDNPDMHDMQINFLIREIGKRYGKISEHVDGKQVGLAFAAFELAKEMMLASIDPKQFGGGELVMLGGIQINAPAPLEDFFLPLYFQLHKDGKSPLNLLSRLDERML